MQILPSGHALGMLNRDNQNEHASVTQISRQGVKTRSLLNKDCLAIILGMESSCDLGIGVTQAMQFTKLSGDIKHLSHSGIE